MKVLRVENFDKSPIKNSREVFQQHVIPEKLFVSQTVDVTRANTFFSFYCYGRRGKLRAFELCLKISVDHGRYYYLDRYFLQKAPLN